MVAILESKGKPNNSNLKNRRNDFYFDKYRDCIAVRKIDE